MNHEANLVVAYIPNHNDLRIAIESRWYRIPVKTKIIPQIIKDKSIEYIAFYQPRKFKHEAYSVRYYAKVKKIEIVKRKELFKDNPTDLKAEDEYYKIVLGNVKMLPKPIVSKRKRRILFIKSNYELFKNAEEINDLFVGSYLEEKFWNELKKNGLNAEREFYEQIGRKKYFLDFAVFCRKRKLAIECDGDANHMGNSNVKYDKRRDNALESKDWHVFRYTTEDIEYRMESTIHQVKEAINNYGGIEEINEDISYKIMSANPNQESLF